jgi:tRNA-modifying protein YgfZ
MVTPSSLAQGLASTSSNPELGSQVRALSERAGVYRTSDRVVHVRGDDARSWLNGQVSNDVRTLAGDQATYAVALTVKGRIISDLWALEEAPGMAFVVPGARVEAALARFEQYIIMEDVELVRDDDLVVLTIQGPAAAEVIAVLPEGVRRYPCARLASVGFDCWVPGHQVESVLATLVERARSLGGALIDEAGWAAAHVALGVPRVALDFGDDTYPQEAGLGPRALSFGKGCYLGQEVIYMLENRGQLARRLVQLEADPSAETPAPGSLVTDKDGKRLGELTSVTAREHDLPARALAFVKRAASEPDNTVWVAGSPYRVSKVVGA